MKKRLLFFALVSLAGALLLLQYKREVLVDSKRSLTIVATTSIIADAVRRIVGDKIIVHGLMGPGVDPHLYRAKESDVHKLAAADLVLYNGLHLEGKMGQVLEGMQRFTQTVPVAQVIDVKMLRTAEFETLYDPHIWFNVSLWIVVVRYIQDCVIELDLLHADVYKKNGDEYCAELEQLRAYVRKRVAEIKKKKRILITAHDAFGYFGVAYGFTVVGLQGLSTDCDISTKDIQQLADYIVEHKVPTIFVETSIPQRAIVAVQNAVRARGWNVTIGPELYSDALGDKTTSASTYIGMVKYNVDAIVDSLL